MASTLQKRYFPARELLVRGQSSTILRTVTGVFHSRGFRPATVLDETTVEMEIGSAAREFWLGDRLAGLFP